MKLMSNETFIGKFLDFSLKCKWPIFLGFPVKRSNLQKYLLIIHLFPNVKYFKKLNRLKTRKILNKTKRSWDMWDKIVAFTENSNLSLCFLTANIKWWTQRILQFCQNDKGRKHLSLWQVLDYRHILIVFYNYAEFKANS